MIIADKSSIKEMRSICLFFFLIKNNKENIIKYKKNKIITKNLILIKKNKNSLIRFKKR
jgi:hypothetical protein